MSIRVEVRTVWLLDGLRLIWRERDVSGGDIDDFVEDDDEVCSTPGLTEIRVWVRSVVSIAHLYRLVPAPMHGIFKRWQREQAGRRRSHFFFCLRHASQPLPVGAPGMIELRRYFSGSSLRHGWVLSYRVVRLKEAWAEGCMRCTCK